MSVRVTVVSIVRTNDYLSCHVEEILAASDQLWENYDGYRFHTPWRRNRRESFHMKRKDFLVKQLKCCFIVQIFHYCHKISCVFYICQPRNFIIEVSSGNTETVIKVCYLKWSHLSMGNVLIGVLLHLIPVAIFIIDIRHVPEINSLCLTFITHLRCMQPSN